MPRWTVHSYLINADTELIYLSLPWILKLCITLHYCTQLSDNEVIYLLSQAYWKCCSTDTETVLFHRYWNCAVTRILKLCCYTDTETVLLHRYWNCAVTHILKLCCYTDTETVLLHTYWNCAVTWILKQCITFKRRVTKGRVLSNRGWGHSITRGRWFWFLGG